MSNKACLKHYIKEIKELRKQGKTLQEIADKFGTTRQAISLVLIAAGNRSNPTSSREFLLSFYRVQAITYRDHLKAIIKSLKKINSSKGKDEEAMNNFREKVIEAAGLLAYFEEHSISKIEGDFKEYLKNN